MQEELKIYYSKDREYIVGHYDRTPDSLIFLLKKFIQVLEYKEKERK